jgi:hypothetical protein
VLGVLAVGLGVAFAVGDAECVGAAVVALAVGATEVLALVGCCVTAPCVSWGTVARLLGGDELGFSVVRTDAVKAGVAVGDVVVVLAVIAAG